MPTRSETVYRIDVGDETVLYDPELDRVHRLNPTAAAVWRHCDGNATVDDIATALRDEFGRQPPQELVWLALGQLSNAGLLAGEVASIIAPTPAMADLGGALCASDDDERDDDD